LSVAALVLLVILSQGCGGSSSDPVSPEPLWVAPADIDGEWITAVIPPETTGGSPDNVGRKIYGLQMVGGHVSGDYTEIYRDGGVARFDVTGTYDADTGELVLTHDSRDYGVADWHFRFESDTEMWEVSPDDTGTGILLFLKA
jgi:hypothetical protein